MVEQAEPLEAGEIQTDKLKAKETAQNTQPGINTTETQEQQSAESESQAGRCLRGKTAENAGDSLP